MPPNDLSTEGRDTLPKQSINRWAASMRPLQENVQMLIQSFHDEGICHAAAFTDGLQAIASASAL